MQGGVRIELRIDSPEACSVAAVSAATGATARSISWSVGPDADHVVEEFALEADGDSDADPHDHVQSLERVLADGSQEIYRFDRSRDDECPCGSIERLGHPVSTVEAQDGALFVTFYVSEIEQVRSVLRELRARYSGLSVERIIWSETEHDDTSLVHVDRDVLTERQKEVLEQAIEMGYFEHPKQANAGEVAEALDVNRATFAEHLAAAQRKVLPTIVGSW
ncbi:helix-turn-helix domain-containing protein [Halobiforma nitratireducens]|uniref:Bacterio-opsin activator HTH domain protein n=1 Tax=Halobiforma nitratireducens JCM 10879 TaxID=1227454 RepID=M0MMK6_9EURY|nr:helix-turn-helix domain-containing protein [Halobiforma nitratireducens]EMA45969.1 Bacterio-opsin activator HTH domain protein [Halobiforma nitratireducens JCM 10879]